MKRLALTGLVVLALLSASAEAVPYIQPTGPAAVVLYNSTVTANGSQPVIGLPTGEVDLIYNIVGTPGGTLPTLTFTIAGSDPQAPGTTITGDSTATSGALNSTGTGLVRLSPLHSSAVNISWAVGGTLPSFAGVYLTLAIKSAISPGTENQIVADAGYFGTIIANTVVVDAGFFGNITATNTVAATAVNSQTVNGSTYVQTPQIYGSGGSITLTPQGSGMIDVQGVLVADAGSFAALSVVNGLNMNSTTIVNVADISVQSTVSSGINICLTAGGNSCLQDDGVNHTFLNPVTGVAGNNGIWAVDGGLTVVGSNQTQGTIGADAGIVDTSMTVGTLLYVDGGIQISGGSPIFIGPGPLSPADGIWLGISAGNATSSNYTFYSNGSSLALVNAPAGTIGLNVGNSGIFSCTASGCATENGRSLTIENGTALTNLGVGSCTLSSGQCNANVSGALGSSLCVASVQGVSQTLVGCDVRADAGSATAFCQSTATGTAAIVCFN